jgi:holin-like protein
MNTESVSEISPPNFIFQSIKQILILVVFWAMGFFLNQHGIPISSGILGMLLLLICLFLKVIKMDQVEIGASVVLGELLLLFVPVVVAVVQYKTLFKTEGWQIVLSISLGTILVMLSTCLTIHYYNRLKNFLQTRKPIQHKHI